jgi:hypothetical protein
MHEEWRVISDHPDYMVSDLGRVKSVSRMVNNGKRGLRRIRTTILRPATKRTGYLAVVLNRKQYLVQILVLTAFVGPRPEGAQCAHNDGVRTNNALPNLRWATCKENQADRVEHGTSAHGSRNHMSKLSETDVLMIRGDTRKRVEVARDYGVTPEAISAIVHRRNWGWLQAQTEQTA